LDGNAADVGQRIRAIREARGWTQSDLAARLGRTQTAVSYWESGRRGLSLDDLVEVAGVLGVSGAELLPDRHRRRPVPALLRAVAEQVDAAQLADELEGFALQAQGLPRPEPMWHIAPASPRDTADALLEAAGVVSPPIPIEELVAGCGVLILPWKFHDIDGLVVELDTGAVIWLNDSQAPTRQRFTLAHELGHHLLRHADEFYVDLGGDLSPNATGEHPGYNWRAERAANDFAANLLMPASMIRRSSTATTEVKALAAQFNVSPAALGFRLNALRISQEPVERSSETSRAKPV
jgi:Zn-dependent peptidase ImmA (M78 family)/transcriptional regulator with XRE-family HTH domain